MDERPLSSLVQNLLFFFQCQFTVFKWVYSRVLLPYVLSHPSLLFTNLAQHELIVVVNGLAKHMAMDRIKVLVSREIRLSSACPLGQ